MDALAKRFSMDDEDEATACGWDCDGDDSGNGDKEEDAADDVAAEE